ncbi:hypothetical protein D3C87_1904290 [compost metagenome]
MEAALAQQLFKFALGQWVRFTADHCKPYARGGQTFAAVIVVLAPCQEAGERGEVMVRRRGSPGGDQLCPE